MSTPAKHHHSESPHRACLQCDWIFRGRTNCPKCGGDTCGARWLHGSFTDENTKTQQPWIDRKVRAYEVQLSEEAGVPPPPQHIPTDRERYLWRQQHGMTRPTDPVQLWVVTYTNTETDLEVLHGVFRSESAAQEFILSVGEGGATLTKGLFYPDPSTTAPIDPINPYTGEVSVLKIAKNIANGHTKFPENMGNPKI
jgi:hypothetical protein